MGQDASEAGGPGPVLIAQVDAARLRAIRARRCLAAIAAGAALLAVGCGDSDNPSDPGSSAVGSPGVETTARQSDCLDWQQATVEERQVIVDSISKFEGGGPSGTLGRHMPDDTAYEVFDRFCGDREGTGALKLYKVYVRAAAFTKPEQ